MEHKNVVKVEIGRITKQCFVIMPFDGLFKNQYEKVIKPAIEEAGLECVRGDEVFSKPQIMADIWKSIRQCRVVLAELSSKNANVFYELGLSHAIGKPAIIITRNEDDVPFDLKALRYIYYDTNDPYWGDNLRLSIRNILKKVISEKSFSSGLENIEADIIVEKETQTAIEDKPKQKVELIDISGPWRVSWLSETSRDKEQVKHHGVLILTQDGSNLVGEITLSISYKDEITVVLENIVGSISNSEISLQGVSYTFIQRSKAETYALDTFNLEFKDKDNLSGEVVADYSKKKRKINLERMNKME